MVKKLLSFILLASITLSTSVINASAQTVKPKNLVLFGDSISTGYGLADTEKSFGYLLSKAFALTDSCYTNFAVNGATSADILTVIKSHTKNIATADRVILTVGGNDVLSVFTSSIKTALALPDSATAQQVQEALITKENAATLIEAQLQKPETQSKLAAVQTDFAKNLLSIVTAIKTANPSAKLYIQTIYNPFSQTDSLSSLPKFADKVLNQMNTIITGSAEKNYTVIDTYTAFKGNALTLTNIAQFDIHPNEAGHTAIFELAYRTITGEPYHTANTGTTYDAQKDSKSTTSNPVLPNLSSGSYTSSASHAKSVISSAVLSEAGSSNATAEVSSSLVDQPESEACESSITAAASSMPAKQKNGSILAIFIALLLCFSATLIIILIKKKK